MIIEVQVLARSPTSCKLDQRRINSIPDFGFGWIKAWGHVNGMLEIRTRIAIIADGYDPTIGIVHGDTRADRDTFVFDRMEPGRPEAERSVLALLKEHEFSARDFGVSENGTCRIIQNIALNLISVN